MKLPYSGSSTASKEDRKVNSHPNYIIVILQDPEHKEKALEWVSMTHHVQSALEETQGGSNLWCIPGNIGFLKWNFSGRVSFWAIPNCCGFYAHLQGRIKVFKFGLGSLWWRWGGFYITQQTTKENAVLVIHVIVWLILLEMFCFQHHIPNDSHILHFTLLLLWFFSFRFKEPFKM